MEEALQQEGQLLLLPPEHNDLLCCHVHGSCLSRNHAQLHPHARHPPPRLPLHLNHALPRSLPAVCRPLRSLSALSGSQHVQPGARLSSHQKRHSPPAHLLLVPLRSGNHARSSSCRPGAILLRPLEPGPSQSSLLDTRSSSSPAVDPPQPCQGGRGDLRREGDRHTLRSGLSSCASRPWAPRQSAAAGSSSSALHTTGTPKSKFVLPWMGGHAWLQLHGVSESESKSPRPVISESSTWLKARACLCHESALTG